MTDFILSDFLHYSWLVLSEPWVITAVLFTLAVVGLMCAARSHPMEREFRRMQYDELVRRANHRAMREAFLRRKAQHEQQKRAR